MSVDLRAVTELGGVPYEFWVNNNEREDFRNHSLSVFVLMPDSGGTVEERKARTREKRGKYEKHGKRRKRGK